MFIGEHRIEKRWIRSRISGHLIVDRVSRKPQEKRARSSDNERERWEQAMDSLSQESIERRIYCKIDKNIF